MRNAILKAGKQLSASTIVALLIALNVYWIVILDVFGSYFERVADAPLLDLANTENILSVTQAQALIATYGAEARNLYWSFFIMDGIMPPLVFGAFALFWVVLLRSSTRPWVQRFFNSPLLLVPLGVGFFDWWENVAFLNAIMSPPGSDVAQLLQIGLFFVWLKAICLFSTFIVTGMLLLYRLYDGLSARFTARQQRIV